MIYHVHLESSEQVGIEITAQRPFLNNKQRLGSEEYFVAADLRLSLTHKHNELRVGGGILSRLLK